MLGVCFAGQTKVLGAAKGVALSPTLCRMLGVCFAGQTKVLGAARGVALSPTDARGGVALPVAAVRIAQAHEQDPTVAVHVFDGQSVHWLLGKRIGPGAGPDVPRLVGQGQFGPVRIEPRAQVQRAGVEQVRQLQSGRVGRSVVAHQVLQVVQHRGAGHQVRSVDIAIGPEARLVGVDAGRMVADAGHPDVAALVALADRFDPHQRRVGACIGPQQGGQCMVLVEPVEGR